MRPFLCALLAILFLLPPAFAQTAQPSPSASHDARMVLLNGKVKASRLAAMITHEADLPNLHLPNPKGEIDLSTADGVLLVRALNRELGAGCRVIVDHDAVTLHVTPQALPHDCEAIRAAVRTHTALASPQAAANQERERGLFIPSNLDPRRPLVILVHGLGCDHAVWSAIIPLLNQAGYQVSWFDYDGGDAIGQSADDFGQKVASLHSAFPAMPLDVVAHSLGALVSRGYIEGPTYNGGIHHLILCGPPNHGSSWASLHWAAEAQEQWDLFRSDPTYHWTWALTEGLGDSADDLGPDSAFLKTLNDLPRRGGVQYTIIAGNQPPQWRVGADLVACTASHVPHRIANWWGVRQCRAKLQRWSDTLRHHTSDSDGPVSLASAKLAGVSDVIVLPVDHVRMLEARDGKQPIVWDEIRETLGKN